MLLVVTDVCTRIDRFVGSRTFKRRAGNIHLHSTNHHRSLFSRSAACTNVCCSVPCQQRRISDRTSTSSSSSHRCLHVTLESAQDSSPDSNMPSQENTVWLLPTKRSPPRGPSDTPQTPGGSACRGYRIFLQTIYRVRRCRAMHIERSTLGPLKHFASQALGIARRPRSH